MRFVSTRNAENNVSFKQAVLDPMPADGGLYVPSDSEDLRRWILYADENTSFSSLSGALTSALINTEFSPLICERIASLAFPFSPVVKKLDDHLYILELYHGPTGTFKDFGVSYLTNALETILCYDDEKAILLDASTGELGACMARALKGKQLLKSILLYPKGKIRGLEESDLVWNGGNIYPIEIDGSEEDCHNIIRKIFSDRELVKKYHLTVANTANIGRLLPQSFFYTFAFSRLKKYVSGDIYYAFSCGNYGNLVSALYGWKLSLPVNGFVLPADNNLKCDVYGKAQVIDSFVPLEKRRPADPASPSNLERLEQIFQANSLMLKSFVFPAEVSKTQVDDACKELFMKYNIYADWETSAAYAASKKRASDILDDEGCLVLLARESPAIKKDFIMHNLGEAPEMSAALQKTFAPFTLKGKDISALDTESVISVLNSLNLRRIF